MSRRPGLGPEPGTKVRKLTARPRVVTAEPESDEELEAALDRVADPIAIFNEVVEGEIRPETMTQTYEVLKLMGAVVGRMALLRVAVDPHMDSRARVSAARALVDLKEDPAEIAKRLRESVFQDLTLDQLEKVILRFKSAPQGETSIHAIIQQVKGESPNGTA